MKTYDLTNGVLRLAAGKASKKSVPPKGHPPTFYLPYSVAMLPQPSQPFLLAIRPQWFAARNIERSYLMTNSTKASKPTHSAYVVKEFSDGSKSFWNRVGSAWKHKDGDGFNVQLETIPLDGRITLRVNDQKTSAV